MERGRRALASLSVGSPLVAAECAESTARQCAVTVSRRGSAAMPGAPGRRRGGSARRGGARERGALRPARIRIHALADAGNTGAGAAISVEVHFRNASGQGRRAGPSWVRVHDRQLPPGARRFCGSCGVNYSNGLRHDRQLLFGGHHRYQIVMDNLGCVFITVLL